MLVKEIMRSFRKLIIKDKFVELHPQKEFHFWKTEKKKEETMKFFTESPYTFDKETYQ